MAGSTPPLGDAAGWKAFTASVTALIGDRDPLTVLSELSEALEAAVAGLGADELRAPEAPAKWSIADVVAHLVDAEVVFGFRVRQILTLEEPPLSSFDQDGWAKLAAARDADVPEMLALLRLLRRRNLRLYAHLLPEQWDRAGIHADRGRETVREIITIIAGHDLAHRRQVARIRERLSA